MTAIPHSLRHQRAPKVVCGGCEHFKEREREIHLDGNKSIVPRARWQFVGRPPSDAHKECLWYNTPEGRAASSGERMGVMLASANGGAGCRYTTVIGRAA